MLQTTIFVQTKEALPVKPLSRGIDRIAVIFDDPNLVANSGLVLIASLVKKLQLEELIESRVELSGRTGGY